MYWLNKIAWMILNPALSGIIILMISVILLIGKRNRVGLVFAISGLLWFYVWSISATDTRIYMPSRALTVKAPLPHLLPRY